MGVRENSRRMTLLGKPTGRLDMKWHAMVAIPCLSVFMEVQAVRSPFL